MWKCLKCGEVLDDDVITCAVCRTSKGEKPEKTPLEVAQEAALALRKQENEKARMLKMVIIAVVIILVLGAGLFYSQVWITAPKN